MNSNGKNDMRIFILNLCMILGGIVLIIQLFNLQIVNGKDYRIQAEKRTSKQVTVVAPRGEILDRHGDIFATNRDGYNVLMYKQSMSTEERNNLILNLVNLLLENNVVYRDTFPISLVDKEVTFNLDTDEEIKQWKKRNKFDENMTALEIFEDYKKDYKLEKYSDEDARKIAGIRYELDRVGYSAFKPYEVATDISKEANAALEERFSEFPGVTVEIQPIRVYPNGNLASHVLGYISKITPEKYEELKDEGYSTTDNIGRSGIESVMERFLRGKNSLQKIEVSASGKYSYSQSEGTETGAQVYLTLDAELQKVAENALANTIYDIANGKYADGSPEAKSGAVVAIDVKTGEILAMASYPDYDPNLFVKGISNDEWSKLNTETKPMFNRNIMGLYSPGSIFKMVVAIAALEEGAITPDTIIVDEGVYKKYKSPQPKCWIWGSAGRTHGPVNVSDAIKTSCNYFFYTVGEAIGIDKIEEYSRKFGLGEKTGIELEGEKEGIVASRKYVEEKENRKWKVGETLSAAIGQSYHSFTPIQIARYAAILANGGKRVRPHLIKSVVTQDGTILDREEIELYVGNELGYDYDEDIPEDLNISKETLAAVFSGMESVTGDSSGTAYNIFKNFPIKVGGKTGSVQVSGTNADNAWFVGFAPYDDPEIAICAVVENGVHGAYTASIVLDVLREYFGLKESTDNISIDAIVNDNTMM